MINQYVGAYIIGAISFLYGLAVLVATLFIEHPTPGVANSGLIALIGGTLAINIATFFRLREGKTKQ